METAKRFILSLSTLLLVSGAALAVPVSASNGSSGSGGSHDATETSATLTKSDDSTTGTQTKTEVENHARDLAEQFRTQARTKLAEDKTKVKEHTQAERQKSCEARKDSLTKRMADAVTHAKNHKAVFDKFYTRVKTFHDTKNLNVSNYDTLTANVDAAQAEAAASITALESLNVSVDCTSQTVADGVSAFQQAVKNTRDSLNAYRTSLVDLITALKAASTSTDNQTNQ